MEISEILTLFNYDCWATEKIINSTAGLKADQFTAEIQCSHGSLRGTFIHILSAEWIWRLRCQKGISPDQFIDEHLFHTPDSVRERLKEEQMEMKAYLTTLGSSDLQRTIAYRTTQGKVHKDKLWHLLLHLFNHGTHHRSEAAHILAQYGNPPGDIDFILYLREILEH